MFIMVIKDESPDARLFLEPSTVRKGRFLWKSKDEQVSYLNTLKQKMMEGFFTSDQVMGALVDDLAPVLGDTAQNTSGPNTIWESFA